MNKKTFLALAMLSASHVATIYAQQPAAHFDMSLTAGGSVTEQVSNTSFAVNSQLPACNVEGIDGQALRFDGYSNYVRGTLPTSSLSTSTLTLRVVLAAESYPMMQVDVAETTPTFATICGNLDESGKKGLALELSSQGDLRFRFASAYANGYLFTVNGTEKLPRGRWCELYAVLDKPSNSAKLYLDGREIGSSKMSRSDMIHAAVDFFVGKDATELKHGPFFINTFCGLIDDIAFYNEAVTPSTPVTQHPSPDFNYPAERYAESLWRPAFHAMPGGSWTNETHGMTYSDGKWHVFFQKNANGPYMSRLHWGHVTSDNLYLWREEPIAFGPSEDYDIKGCWSGCLYDDNGTPTILYTAVDNARATIAKATANDGSLLEWQKQGIVVNGRPAGLSDDFRDPYHFTANGQQYIIVGTSKNNVGACTLHRLENGSWTNDGTLFFQGGNANQHGTFWEMPNVTPMGDGRWLFTCTPLNTGAGVRTLCWVGTIGADGKFTPDGSGMQYLEMGGISRDGYGLLSPTIYQTTEGKTLLLGIVPDKLPTQTNFEMGWAHNYSLPRELSLDANNQLVQKPYSGLTAMRTQTKAEYSGDLLGRQSLAPVSGRQIELVGEFTVGSGEMGFRFLKSGNRQAILSYDGNRGTLTLNLTSLDRQVNDAQPYNGVYSATLPEKPAAGEKLKLHLFLDGSIADIFVNDRWAFSVRLFPTDAAATEAEAFCTATTTCNLKAWTLDPQQTASGGATAITRVQCDASQPHQQFYDLQGRLVTRGYEKGIYIQEGRKVCIH